MNFGTEKQKQEYLPRVARGDIRFCLGITEPDGNAPLYLLFTRTYDQTIVNDH